MTYLSIIECPNVFTGENAYSMSSMDMLPRLGITQGLVSRHMRATDQGTIAVCIWTDLTSCERFLDEDWYAKADVLWGDRYVLKIQPIDETSDA